MRLSTVLLLCALVLIGSSAEGLGPGAHLYVASRVMGTGWPGALFGSMAPDLCNLASTPQINGAMAGLTHCEFDRLSPSPFAMAFATHNNLWGVDSYIHCHHNPGYEDTYFTLRMKELLDEFEATGLTMLQAEDIVDAVLDYLLRKDLGPEFGHAIALSAQFFGAAQTQELVEAFALPLSQRVAGLSTEDAEDEIRSMAQLFKGITRIYGEQLALWELPGIRALLVEGFQSYLAIDAQTADALFTSTEELCWDYREELDRIAGALPSELEALSPAYKLPTGRAAVLAQAVLVCALFLLAARTRAVN